MTAAKEGGPDPSARLAGVGMVVLTLASWTTIPLFLKSFTHDIDAWTANGWRYGFSALLWLPPLLLAVYRKRLPPGLWKAALAPSIFNAVAQVAFGLAPYYMDPGLMAFSLRAHIVFVTIGAAILFAAERRIIRSRGFLVGLVMVVAGTTATIILKPDGLGGGTAFGVGLAVLSGLLYAGYALGVRKWMHGTPPLLAFAVVSQYTAAAMVALMLIFGERAGSAALDLSGGKFGLLLLSAVIGIGIGHTLYFAAIARLGLAVSAGVVQLQPITVSIASLVIFGERLTGWQWVAGLCAVAGAGVMLHTQAVMAKPTTPPATPEQDGAFDDLPVEGDIALVAQSNDPPSR